MLPYTISHYIFIYRQNSLSHSPQNPWIKQYSSSISTNTQFLVSWLEHSIIKTGLVTSFTLLVSYSVLPLAHWWHFSNEPEVQPKMVFSRISFGPLLSHNSCLSCLILGIGWKSLVCCWVMGSTCFPRAMSPSKSISNRECNSTSNLFTTQTFNSYKDKQWQWLIQLSVQGWGGDPPRSFFAAQATRDYRSDHCSSYDWPEKRKKRKKKKIQMDIGSICPPGLMRVQITDRSVPIGSLKPMGPGGCSSKESSHPSWQPYPWAHIPQGEHTLLHTPHRTSPAVRNTLLNFSG